MKLQVGASDTTNLQIPERTVSSMFKAILGHEGFMEGHIYEFVGDSGVGKSATLMWLGGMFQKAGHKYGHVDAENAFNKKFAQRLGVNTDEIVMNAADQPITCGEEAFDLMHSMVQAGCKVIVNDSISVERPRSIMVDGKDNIGAHALFISKELPKILNAAAGAKAVILQVNQLRNKIGVMFGDPTTITGGKTAEYLPSVRVKVTKKAVVKGNNGEELGYIVTYNATKNRGGFKRGAFEIVMNRGFVPKLAETAVQWAKAFEKQTGGELALIDEEAKTIAGISYAGKGRGDAALVAAIKGNEKLVFDAVDAYFTEKEDNEKDFGDMGEEADTTEGEDGGETVEEVVMEIED